MRKIAFFILTIIITGCLSTSKISAFREISEDNKDVFILTNLIRDYYRNTDGRFFNLDTIIQYDTLKRISNSFEKIELKYRGGHISIFYKLSSSRDNSSIKLSDKEIALKNRIWWGIKDLKGEFDGEIKLDYGERFYRIIGIKINKNSKVADGS